MLTGTICCSLQVLLQASCSPADRFGWGFFPQRSALFERLWLGIVARSGELIHGFARNWLCHRIFFKYKGATWDTAEDFPCPEETSTKPKMLIFFYSEVISLKEGVQTPRSSKLLPLPFPPGFLIDLKKCPVWALPIK